MLPCLSDFVVFRRDVVGYFVDSKFEPGCAEAYGALCRIFCSHRSDQEIRPVYLSRFYLAVAIGLLYSEVSSIIVQLLLVILID